MRLQPWKESENLRQISKALGRSKTVICIYLKSLNQYGIRKLTDRPEKLSPQFKRRIVRKVKKTSLSTSEILKSLEDASCTNRTTIRRHLNNGKIKYKKRIHHPRLTMKQKEKQLEYAGQYQTMSAKEWQKVVFLDGKKFNLDGPDGFQKYWHAKNFSEENYSTKHSGWGSLMIWVAFSSSGICQWLTKSCRLCEDAEWFISCIRSVLPMWRRIDFSAI